MQVEMKSVSKDEFSAFLKSYPRKLERDVYGACEPPMVTYNDFARAPQWPDSIVASTDTEGTFYRIVADLNAPIPDDGKRDTDTPVFDMHGKQVNEGDRVRILWGQYGSTEPGAALIDNWREHTVLIRDKGTKYETWSLDDCANHLRSMTFEIIEPQP
jgi:hypothetical protein